MHMAPALDKIIRGNIPPNELQSREIRLMLGTSQAELLTLEKAISQVPSVPFELEQQRSFHLKSIADFQRALSSIRRIPPEILAEIFTLCRNNSLDSETYSTADPREAPMLLGHISSYWRSICHGTPLLWDQVQLISGLGMPELPCVKEILARSRNVPLFVQLTTPHGMSLRQEPMCLPVEPVVGLFLDLHRRIKTITLHIPSLNLLPPHNMQSFPILASLDIILADANGEPDVTSVLSVFKDAPSLRSVSLIAHCSPAQSFVPALPWTQLTELRLHMPISLRDAYVILTRCQKLQIARLSDCTRSDNIERVEHIVQLADLWIFDFATEGDDVVPDTFFDAFSFPNLRALVIRADCWSPHILLTFHDRSRFQLQSLELDGLFLSSDEVVELLKLLPTLRQLELKFCSIDDGLLEAFTFDPRSTSHLLALPRLRTLSVLGFTDQFEGTSVASMVESLCRYSGRPNSAFPVLEVVHLWLYGDKFDSDIERRLAAACNTGLISDHQAQQRGL
ncbi:hypothetical protein B0H13DRAFT_555228 [Mycena leptocephala]|nr:hypothetical protein B0H13DRAFT_555228 [Mycena leptocephala]